MGVERERPFLGLAIWLWTAKLLPEFQLTGMISDTSIYKEAVPY